MDNLSLPISHHSYQYRPKRITNMSEIFVQSTMKKVLETKFDLNNTIGIKSLILIHSNLARLNVYNAALNDLVNASIWYIFDHYFGSKRKCRSRLT